MQFITWEPPLVSGAIDLITTSEKGNTALCAINHKDIPAGNLLLEAIYVLESMAVEQLQISRYLPLTTVRVVVDSDGKDVSNKFSHRVISKHQITVGLEIAVKVVKTHKEEIRNLIKHSENIARQQTPEILSNAQHDAHEVLQREINRLKALRQVNPNVRHEEIAYFETQYQAANKALQATAPRLDALRVIVTT